MLPCFSDIAWIKLKAIKYIQTDFAVICKPNINYTNFEIILKMITNVAAIVVVGRNADASKISSFIVLCRSLARYAQRLNVENRKDLRQLAFGRVTIIVVIVECG